MPGSVALLAMLIAAPDVLDRVAADAIKELFVTRTADVWPGFELSKRSLVVYRPSRWMLLLNCRTPSGEFGSPPRVLGLSDLPILYNAAPTADLTGQLAFDFDVCGVKAAAIPVLNEAATVRETAAFLAHEAFHQYQSETFHESDSLAEERYPIQDRTNAALVVLEMKLLDAALSGSSDALRQFIAVRHERWRRNPAVHAFEHYLETHEGTAKYVEAYMREGRASGASDYIISELRRFHEKGSIAAPDLPRNRVYAVGAAIAILLDRFHPSWKSAIAEATTTDLFTLLRDRVQTNEETLAGWLADAKRNAAYDVFVAAAESAIAAHESAFREALHRLEESSRQRISVTVASRGLRRSRSTSAPRLTVDAGARTVCETYDVFTLRTDGEFELTVRGAGVLEEIDYAAGFRTITVYLHTPATIARTEEGVLINASNFKLKAPKGIQVKAF